MDKRYFKTGCDLLDMVTGGDKGVYGFPEGRFINIVGDKSAGKAQPLYSKVLTPTGWKTMGDIHVGDMVCVPSGGTAEVIGEFPQGKRPIYEFIFNDDTRVRSADNHYWIVQSVNQATSNTVFNKKNGCSLVTTKDIVELSKSWLDKPYNRLYIPYVEKYKESHSRLSKKIINSVTYIGEEECKCIYIAHPEHLYITDNYTVTHNTFLSNEIIASAYYKYPRDKFKWVYDDCERGYSFDTQSMYGFDIIPQDESKVVCSTTVEEAFCNIVNFADSLSDEQFGIYVLDSLDGLTSEEQDAQAEDRLKAFKNGKEYDKGSYGMGKPKYLSREFFPQLCSKIQNKHILVIIISQVRDNVDMFSFEKFKRSGGKALDFYAHMVLWLATAKKMTKKDRTVGVVVKAKVTKGKVPRPFRECFFNFIYDYGLDNTGSNIDYLYDLRTPTGELASTSNSIIWGNGTKDKPTVAELKNWLKANNLCEEYLDKHDKVTLALVSDYLKNKEEQRKKFEDEFGLLFTREGLINYIEENNLQEELRRKVEAKWESLEDAIKTSRKKKYGTQPVGTE